METIQEVDVNQNSDFEDLQIEGSFTLLSKDGKGLDRTNPGELAERINQLEAERTVLTRRMSRQHDLETEVENLKNELQATVDAHKRLEESVRLCQNQNGDLEDKNSVQLKERGKLEAIHSDLQQQLDIKTHECEMLQKKINNLQDVETNSGDLQEKLHALERDNKKKTSRIDELEMEILTPSQGQQKKRDEDDDHHRSKLEKELRQMQEKETEYLLEIEEIDLKLESFEQENGNLRRQLEQATTELESNTDLLDLLEEAQEDKRVAEQKFKAENELRIKAEKERAAVQEDLEEDNHRLVEELNNAKMENAKYIMQISEQNSLLESSRNTTTKAETELKVIKEGLETDVKAKDKRIKELIKKQEELLCENDSQAKKSTESAERGNAIKVEYERKVLDLEQKVQDLREERRKIEQDSYTRMVSSIEKEYEFNRKYALNVKELEKSKEELGVLQEHLRMATDKNSELQMEVNRAKTRFEADINVQMIEQEVKLKEKNRQDTETLMRDIQESHDRERLAYDDRINEQDSINLQLRSEINELRHELQRARSLIIATTQNGSSSRSTTPEINSTQRLSQDNHRNGIQDDFYEEDMLGDRELRRIAYKIYDGSWSKLANALEIKGHEHDQIMASPVQNQEKVYRLLMLWRSSMHGSRDELLGVLAEALERIKRKDVVRFLKDMGAGVTSGGGGLKKRFKSLVK